MSNTDPHIAKMEAQLNEWKAKLDVVKAKLDKANAESRIGLQKQADAFETHYAEAKRGFTEFCAASEDKASALKAGLEKAWDAFKSEFERA